MPSGVATCECEVVSAMPFPDRVCYRSSNGYSEDLILLFKCLFRLPNPPNLTRCLDSCCQVHVTSDKPLVRLLDFLSALELSVSVRGVAQKLMCEGRGI